MSTLLAVDPGLRGCGVALFTFDNRVAFSRLTAADYVRNDSSPDRDIGLLKMTYIMARSVQRWYDRISRSPGWHSTVGEPAPLDVLVCEWPRVYTVSKLKGDPNDLLPLTAVGGALAGLLHPLELRSPHPDDWKGQLKKGDAYEGRVRDRLSDAEKKAISAPTNHNCLDAVGIGLFSVGRFERIRVFPR